VQPTLEELIRQSLVCLLWLLVVGICLRFAWLALSPPRRAETAMHASPSWLPRGRRRPLRAGQQADSLELVDLFRRPQRLERPETVTATAPRVTSETEAVAEVAKLTDQHVEAEICVRLLGRLSVGEGDGTGVRERATRGLIAYLVLKRAPATMDELVEALWPGEPPTKARQRLWKAKRQAQQLLGERLVRRQASYAIDRHRVRTDIDELDELRIVERLDLDLPERALRLLWEGPLADVDYPWADGERRRLQAIQAELLEQLAGARLDDGDASGALALAERLIELDRLNERGWCLAMDAEGALGNRQAVLARYERLRGELDERLGLRPGAEAKETYHRLLGQA
jgi:DNA-binding SARP family transcriptional activator